MLTLIVDDTLCDIFERAAVTSSPTEIYAYVESFFRANLDIAPNTPVTVVERDEIYHVTFANVHYTHEVGSDDDTMTFFLRDDIYRRVYDFVTANRARLDARFIELSILTEGLSAHDDAYNAAHDVDDGEATIMLTSEIALALNLDEDDDDVCETIEGIL